MFSCLFVCLGVLFFVCLFVCLLLLLFFCFFVGFFLGGGGVLSFFHSFFISFPFPFPFNLGFILFSFSFVSVCLYACLFVLKNHWVKFSPLNIDCVRSAEYEVGRQAPMAHQLPSISMKKCCWATGAAPRWSYIKATVHQTCVGIRSSVVSTILPTPYWNVLVPALTFFLTQSVCRSYFPWIWKFHSKAVSGFSIISRLILVTRNHVSISACTATGQLAPKPQPGWSRLRCFISFRLDIAVFVVIVTPWILGLQLWSNSWNPRTTAVEASSPVSSFLLSHNFLCL